MTTTEETFTCGSCNCHALPMENEASDFGHPGWCQLCAEAFDTDERTAPLRELAAEYLSRAASTVERVGIDFENEEVLPALDSSESEDYGYWLAMQEAAEAALKAAKALHDEPVSPNQCLHDAAFALQAALDTGSAAAGSLRLTFTTQAPDLYLVIRELRSAAEAIR